MNLRHSSQTQQSARFFKSYRAETLILKTQSAISTNRSNKIHQRQQPEGELLLL